MTSPSIFRTLPCFFCQVQLLVQVSDQYRHWFWIYEFFFNIWRNSKFGQNLAGISLMKSYLMLRNARFTAFTAFQLLRENQQEEKILASPIQIMVKGLIWAKILFIEEHTHAATCNRFFHSSLEVFS